LRRSLICGAWHHSPPANRPHIVVVPVRSERATEGVPVGERCAVSRQRCRRLPSWSRKRIPCGTTSTHPLIVLGRGRTWFGLRNDSVQATQNPAAFRLQNGAPTRRLEGGRGGRRLMRDRSFRPVCARRRRRPPPSWSRRRVWRRCWTCAWPRSSRRGSAGPRSRRCFVPPPPVAAPRPRGG
jgi:hypothetical protein